MSAYTYTPYWFDALPEGQRNLWANHKMWGSEDSLQSIASYAMLTAFYDSSIEQYEQRRNLLYHYLLGPFDDSSEADALRLFRRTLPITSFIPKVVQNLCIAYNQAPQRTWKKGESEEQTGTKLLRQVYKQMRADGRLQINYRYAKLCSGTAVGVYVGRRGRLQIEILTPDLFRYVTPTLFPDEITYFTRPLIEQKGDKVRTVFQVWTPEDEYYTDATGEETKYWDGQEYIERRANPYGRVPYIVSRLVEPNTLTTFGGGLFDVVEANIVANKHQWLGDSSATYESFGHWLGINLGLGANERLKMGFGKATFAENVESGGGADLAPPDLQNISTNGQYDRIGEFRDNYVEMIQRGLGLPQSVYAKNSGTPPSGIARMLERLELLEQRDSDIDLLKLFEQEFSDLVTTVYNTDVAPQTNKPKIPEGLEVEVQFVEEGILDEPATMFELDVKALLAGVMLPSRFIKTHAGKEVASEEEAVRWILANQKLIDPIRSALAGGSPQSEPPPGVRQGPGITVTADDDTGSTPAVDPQAPGGLIPSASDVSDAATEPITTE